MTTSSIPLREVSTVCRPTFTATPWAARFDYTNYNLDLRKYFSPRGPSIVALQAYLNVIRGTPPFQALSTYGGANLMRGYYNGRYRDKSAVVLQAEYRRFLWWRFGMAVFGGVADVRRDPSDFSLSAFNSTAGAGLRILFDKNEHINVRIDFAFGGGQPGPYITINEAF